MKPYHLTEQNKVGSGLSNMLKVHSDYAEFFSVDNWIIITSVNMLNFIKRKQHYFHGYF